MLRSSRPGPRITATLTLAAVAALGTRAHAGHAARTPEGDMVAKVAELLDGHFGKEDWTSTPEELARTPTPAACFDVMKPVADDAHVYSSQAFRLPAHQKDADGTYILGADAKALCQVYATVRVHEAAETAIVQAFLARTTMQRPVDGMYAGEAKTVGDTGARCAAAIDEALAASLPATEPIASKRYQMPAIALGEARATYCQPAIDFGAARAGEIAAAAQAKHDAIAAVYKKAGIKGKRLELFVRYGLPADAGFYLAGCERAAETAAEMAKAKKLFIWLEGSAGYTIRTFAFHGDDYTDTEHSYDTQAQAYRGCH
jgi:hypothetical protein